MARFHVDNRMTNAQQAITTTFKTQVQLWAATATLCRGRAVALQMGPDGAPNVTDCQIVYEVQRATADGTSTAVTPDPLNPADVASRTVAHNAYTAEGTYTLDIFSRSLNQRASMQWAAQDTDAMLTWAATNLVGLSLIALSPTYASNVLFGIEYDDL
jgi:hypothetical protein